MLRISARRGSPLPAAASNLLFPNPLLRPPAERIEENRKGQAGLWPYGISGDLPIALITIGEARISAWSVRCSTAHTYWRRHGLMAELVILNEEAGGYERPLRERLERLIQAHSCMRRLIDQGIFLRSAAEIPERTCGCSRLRQV